MIWTMAFGSEFAEEGLREDAEVDVAINLEAESKRGK